MLRPFKDKRPTIYDSSIIDVIGEDDDSTEVSQSRETETEEEQFELERMRERESTDPPESGQTTAPSDIPVFAQTDGTFVIIDKEDLKEDIGECGIAISLRYRDKPSARKVQPGVALYDIDKQMLREFGGSVSAEVDHDGTILYPGFTSGADKDVNFIVFTSLWSVSRRTIDDIVDGSVSFLDDEFDLGDPKDVSVVSYEPTFDDMVDNNTEVEHKHMVRL